MDNQVIGSALEAVGMVIAATITGVGLFVSAKRISSREKLKQDLELALNDLLAFNAMEAELLTITSMSKTAFRELMRQKNVELSGKHTPSLVRRKIRQLE